MREGDALSQVVLEAAVEVADRVTEQQQIAAARHAAVETVHELLGGK